MLKNMNFSERLRSMSWTLGKAEEKDSNRINELFIEMLRTIYNTDQVNGYSDGDLDRFFDGRDEWISIAINDDKIIAFLSMEVHHDDEEYIYLDDLSVTKQYRNNGIGTKLISNAEAYATDINIHAKVYLHNNGLGEPTVRGSLFSYRFYNGGVKK